MSVEMLVCNRWKQSLLFSIFSFIVGCMITCFFMKIDDGVKRPKSLPTYLIEPETGVQTDSNNSRNLGQTVYILVILITTNPTNVGKRNVLRETWLQFCKDNLDVRYYFVLGTAKLEENQRTSLLSEQEQYNDFLFLPTVVDNYSLLTKKVLSAFVWVDKNINNYQYVLKCDDDSFVLVNEIVHELQTNFHSEKGVSLYWGFFSGKSHVKKRGKWQEASWILCDYYLPYALGGGYVLSQRLINLISRNSHDLLCFRSEDVSVGVWLAPFVVNREHDCRFDTEFKSRGCSNQYLVTHKRTEEEMRTLYTNLKNSGKLCHAEYSSRPSYIYNWDVPPSECCARVMYDPNIP